MYQTIGFIGTGNMGSAVARAADKSAQAACILLSNRTSAKAEALAQDLSAGVVSTNEEIAASAQLIFLGVKPQMMPDVLPALSGILKGRKDRFLLVSMAAGLTCARIRELAGVNCPVIRIMPNTPAAIGMGMVEYCGLDATQEELEAFAALLAPAGLLDAIPENLMDAASGVSGCGIAYANLFIEALADGGVACGLPRAKALLYAAQALAGTAHLVLESGQHPGVLKDAVCSPGGTTIQGVRVLEERGFRGAAMDAVIAAYDKTLTLK